MLDHFTTGNIVVFCIQQVWMVMKQGAYCTIIKLLFLSNLKITGPVPAPKSRPLSYWVKSIMIDEKIGETNF